MIKQVIIKLDKKYLNSFLVTFYLKLKYLLQIEIIYFKLKYKKQKLLKNHNLNHELVVSITSYYKRFNTLPLVINSLLNQTVKPDEIQIWIEEKDFNLIPKRLSKFNSINFKKCENNLYSYKKILPTLKENQNRYIVTFDDDIIYQRNVLESLVKQALKNPKDVVANRIHKIKLKDNLPDKYNNWFLNDNSNSELNFFTGVGGVLYPPNCFYKDIMKIEKFKKICPNNDDIWLNWMVKLNNFKITHSGFNGNFIMIKSIKSGLFKKNVKQNYNDTQIKAIISEYGFPQIKSRLK